MYHSVGETRKDDHYGLSVTTHAFAEHLKIINEINCKVLALATEANHVDISDVLNIAITFDDGFSDNLDAAEILIRNKTPFSIYCIGSAIDQPGYLTRSQIRELASEKLCTIGGHGWTHTPIGTLTDYEQNQELQKSKSFLEDIIGEPIKTMSLPHGSLNRHTVTIAQKVGFELVGSSRPGVNRLSATPPSCLKRTEVRPHHIGAKFRELIAGSDDWREAPYLVKAALSPFVRSQWRPFSPLSACSVDAKGAAN